MEITVVVSDLIKEIEDGLKDYEGRYSTLLELYEEKLTKYTEYVSKYVARIKSNEIVMEDLQSAPSKPAWLRDSFVDTLEALKAHKEATVVMEDHEYTSAKSGLERLRHSIAAGTASLNSMSY